MRLHGAEVTAFELFGAEVKLCEHGLTMMETPDGQGWEFFHGDNPEARRAFTKIDLLKHWAAARDANVPYRSPVSAWIDEIHRYEA